MEYILDNSIRKKTFVYMPIVTELLNRNDILEKLLIEESVTSQSGHFKTFRDGLFFKKNPLLSREELSIAIGLYVDGFEIGNPLGTSKKVIKYIRYVLCIGL